MPEVRIGNVPVGDGHPTFVIAEIGINHNGFVSVAKKLIDVAKEAGCQAVKFQKRTVPIVYTSEELAKPREVPSDIIENAIERGVLSEESVYSLLDSHLANTTNGDLKWALEFTKEEYAEIDRYCKEKDILWFASPWDEESVDFLEEFNPPCYKVASASLTDDGLLRYIRAKGRPVILSTGMSTAEQIEHAIDVLDRKNLIVLHCTSTYPSEDKDLNLLMIRTLKEAYPDLPIGYSGHDKGVHTSVYAVAVGACVVERHITLDRTMWGSDQAASVAPKGLEMMVKSIRTLELTLGDGVKRVLDAELPIIKKLRRK